MYVLLKWSVALFSLCMMSVANAQNVHGILRVVKGDVQIKSAKTGQKARARIGEKVFPKDVIVTGKDARAKIVMVDNNEINVSPESQIEIQHYEYNPAEGKKDVLLNVIYGKVRSKVEQKYDGKTSKFQIKTPSAVAGVRGTDFITGYNPANRSSQVITFEGRVEFGLPGPGGTIQNPVSVTPGQQASNSAGTPPSAPAPVPKEELAKMDNDSKADTPKSEGSDQRQPANDKKEEKKEEKQEAKEAKQEAKQEAKEEKKEEKKEAKEAKQEAKQQAREEKKEEKKGDKQSGSSGSAGSKSGSAAGAAAGSTGSSGDSASTTGDANRSPASVSPGGDAKAPPPPPGPDTKSLPPPIEVSDSCGGGRCAPPLPPLPQGPPPMPTPFPGPNIGCDAVCIGDQLKKNTLLKIRVNN